MVSRKRTKSPAKPAPSLTDIIAAHKEKVDLSGYTEPEPREDESKWGSLTVVEIAHWEWRYSMHTRIGKWTLTRAPFEEYRTIRIYGKPRGRRLSGIADGHVTIDAKLDMTPYPYGTPAPNYISRMSYGRGRFDAHLSVPRDILSPLITMLCADRIKYVHITGSKWKWGKADIFGFRLLPDLVDEDIEDDV